MRSEEDEKNFNFLVQMISDIRNILRKERVYRNLTQSEMADKMGVHRSTIVGCENGYNINFDMLQKYVMTLKGIDIISKSCGKRIKKSRKSK